LCARQRAGTVTCWTDAAFDAGSGARVPPAAIPNTTDAVGLANDYENLCIVHADGRLTCWGGRDHAPPHDILPAHSVAPPVAGALEGCAIRPDGLVACWGNDASGQLGDGAIMKLDAPAAVPGL